MTYNFVECEVTEDTQDNNEIVECLQWLLNKCDFIVTNYNTMYSTDNIIISDGHRGPILRHKDHLNFDWWYNIKGGYILEDNENN